VAAKSTGTQRQIEDFARESGSNRIDDTRKQITFRGAPLELSPTEYRILQVLLEHPGWVYSREQLMARACEEPAASLERTEAFFKHKQKDRKLFGHAAQSAR
jgi:DNA-binding response OmpR family regulator